MFVARSMLESFYKDSKKLEVDLKLASDSSLEDKLLFEWLSQEEDVWPALCPVFERRIHTRKGFDAWLLNADQCGFQLSSDLKRVGAFFIVLELREYAGHSLWNQVGKVPHYEDILKNVHDRVCTRFSTRLHQDMSVSDREMSLSAMILQESLEKLSPEKVYSLLRESRFETVSDFHEVKENLKKKLRSTGASGMKSMLGKTVARKFGVRLIETAFGSTRLASLGPLGGLAAKVLPFALRRAGLYLSLGFLLKDAYQLGGEATRITNPAVIIIALYRSLSGR